MVVPGYFALHLGDPAMVAMTLAVGILTYLVVRFMMFFMVVYGRRRTVLMILVGFLIGALVRNYVSFEVSQYEIDLTVIGFIIPGLIAIWIDRQGLVETASTLMISSVMVRMASWIGGDMDDNPDITDYYGYGKLSALYRWRGNSFSASVRGNLGTGKGAVEAGWFSPPLFGPLRGYVQVFSGYGESLIDYNWNQTTIGAGIAISDGL